MMPAAAPTLHDCASEPIRFSGAIQPHGYLVSCVLPDWTIRHVSANADGLLGAPAQSLVGANLRDFVNEELLQTIADVAHLSEPGSAPLRAAVGNVGPEAKLYDISVHVVDDLLHLEFEGRLSQLPDAAPTVVAQSMIAHAASMTHHDQFHQLAVEQMRLLTGHARVLVYRFLPDGAGEVIAEAHAAEMEPLLGLRFPESDIPAQARALYVRNRIRVLPDTHYTPVPILSDDASAKPLDLGLHILRSVSPVHREYSRNIGIRSSMSISILSGDALWGLIVCHHPRALAVTASVRAAAELFGLFVSMRVSAHEQGLLTVRDEYAREVREALWRSLSLGHDFDQVVIGQLDNLSRSLSCDGAALWRDGQWHAVGNAPAAPAPAFLQAWLDAGDEHHAGVLATDRAADWIAPDAATDGLAGVLAIRLDARNWLLFFRNEQVERVTWASEPVRPEPGAPLPQKLHPRARLAAWRETIRGRSMAWSATDGQVAERLRQLLGEFRGRARSASHGVPGAFESNRLRMDLLEQRRRLERLSGLLEGLVHLDATETASLAERIAALEIELHALGAGSRIELPQD